MAIQLISSPLDHLAIVTMACWNSLRKNHRLKIVQLFWVSDVNTLELKFPRTAIPAEETSYFCDFIPLQLPDNGAAYHVIAYEPIIDNVQVMHHTLVYGCRDNESKFCIHLQCMLKMYYTISSLLHHTFSSLLLLSYAAFLYRSIFCELIEMYFKHVNMWACIQYSRYYVATLFVLTIGSEQSIIKCKWN